MECREQLYFDRVHPIVPMLDRSRYFAWSRNSETNEHQTTLQYAMWTLTMALSSQLDHMRDMLYMETRRKLEHSDHCQKDTGTIYIEEVQAWILIAYYEFLRCNYRRGWLSAGRIFRLIQLLRLHEIDRPRASVEPIAEDARVMEEKRRTFWVAYCLDRLVSLSNGFPLTLNEETICTLMPASESELSTTSSAQVCFLAEAMNNQGMNSLSPLAVCATMITTYGRALSHKQVSTFEQTYADHFSDFWMRHEWIDSVLTQMIESFSQNHPFVSVSDDPLTIFNFMITQATIISLCKAIEQLDEVQQQISIHNEYQARALHAAREIARLSRDIGFFKVSTHTIIAAGSHDTDYTRLILSCPSRFSSGLNGCFYIVASASTPSKEKQYNRETSLWNQISRPVWELCVACRRSTILLNFICNS
ncbi:transcriptional activator [Hyphodiscus hymeniophilus]|uniref:Transcriptional activator n=1 Tax=Hyphodiscus hymeniophilus TaxID=353542 RepID=A0A9P6SR13_9HELO|nr:transcriptional activator [Hyphodiscus hymeniophilus]